MKNFALECWDEGRVTVNRAFADSLRAHNLTTFDAIMNYTGGSIAKNVLRERTTTRIDLPETSGPKQAFFLKRHGPSPLKEFIKPWLRLTRPILGARNEWNAILAFHEIGIPTMIPVAIGESGRDSFLLTESIEGCRKLSHWVEDNAWTYKPGSGRQRNTLLRRIALTARQMHKAGMHHQDFYLTHLMVPADDPERELFVIDLGRVRRHRRLGKRWIVKDLAQLNFSTPHLSRDDRLRFLETYLARPLCESDQPFVDRIERKTASIARHSQKNGL